MILTELSSFEVGLFDLLEWLESNLGPSECDDYGDYNGDGWFLQRWNFNFTVGISDEKMAMLFMLRWC